MKKTLLLFLLLFSLTLSDLLLAARASVVERVTSSTVFISSPDGNGGDRICSGFVVEGSGGRALTARHCVRDFDVIQVNTLFSLVVKKNENFALLSMINQPPIGALELRKKPMELTQRILAFGFGWGEMEILGRGISIFKGRDFAVDGPFITGMSGGPITDEDGRVVGLIQASNNIVGIACGVQEIKDFLNQP